MVRDPWSLGFREPGRSRGERPLAVGQCLPTVWRRVVRFAGVVYLLRPFWALEGQARPVGPGSDCFSVLSEVPIHWW